MTGGQGEFLQTRLRTLLPEPGEQGVIACPPVRQAMLPGPFQALLQFVEPLRLLLQTAPRVALLYTPGKPFKTFDELPELLCLQALQALFQLRDPAAYLVLVRAQEFGRR